jgi:hypothetical protein
MFRKVTLALVAAASLSAMALAPTSASAGGFIWPKYPHHHHHHWGHGFGVGFVGGGYDGCYVTRRVLTPYGFRWRTVNVCYCPVADVPFGSPGRSRGRGFPFAIGHAGGPPPPPCKRVNDLHR